MGPPVVTDFAARAPSAEPVATAAAREDWVDALRVGLIAGVIVLHTATGYVVDFAGWYYDDEVDASGPGSAILTVPGLLGGLFWLGPLFLLAGWFSARSLARRGPGGFARARLVRLGIPLVVFVVLINPLADYLGNWWDEGAPFTSYLTSTEVGAMWFVAALLAFSLVYAGLRTLRRAGAGAHPPSLRAVALAMAVIAAGSWLVWLRWPLLEEAVLNLKFAHWPQGAVLFAVGAHSAEAGWVEHVPSARRVRALGWTALAGSVGFLALVAIGVSAGSEEDLGPATDWPVVCAALLNGLVAVSFTLWFVLCVRARLHGRRVRFAWAARGSYAAYVVHPLVLIILMMAIAGVPLGPWVKFLLVAAVGVPACFAVGFVLTRVPGVSRVL